MVNNILITGGSGLVGRALTKKLVDKGHSVTWLSRKENLSAPIKQYRWNIKENYIDEQALENIDTVVHLAGASIADGRWTSSYKKIIRNSRIKSLELLTNLITKKSLPVKNLISTSAVGFYGNRGDELLFEDSSPEKNWLAKVCIAWEAAADPLTEWGLRTAIVRIGIVLSTDGGALPKLVKPIKNGINPKLGNGNQYYSWIHLDDLTAIFTKIIEDPKLIGVYNGVAPNPVTYNELVKELAQILDKKTLNPSIPSLFIKFGLGQRARIVLDSAKVSAQKIMDKGYQFKFNHLSNALENLLA